MMKELESMHEYLQNFAKSNDKLSVHLRNDRRDTLIN